jgi:hypothetical protein
MDSDTDLAVLSFVPELPENNPLSLEEANRVRVLVNQMEGAERLFLHAMVIPNAPEVAPLQLMKDAVDRYPIAAWKRVDGFHCRPAEASVIPGFLKLAR